MSVGGDYISYNGMPDGLSQEVIDLPKIIKKVSDNPDGSSTYELLNQEDEPEVTENNKDFYRNLVDELDYDVVTELCSELIEAVEQDIESRSEWEQSYTLGMKLLGFKLEEFRDYPFPKACSAYDSTLSTALLNFFALARAELLPNNGPCRDIIHSYSNVEKQQISNKINKFFNYYHTVKDKDYYPDTYRLLLFVGLTGTGVKKVYPDPVTHLPKPRNIDPQDFIVNTSCSSILSSSRLTHREYLTRKEILLRQKKGFYKEEELPEYSDTTDSDDKTRNTVSKISGIKQSDINKKSIFEMYEIHADVYLEGFKEDEDEYEIPKPYIITICKTINKVFSIRRNYKEDDETFKRKEYFNIYNYLPGFGIMGIGLANMMGSNALALTSILRQLIDKGMLNNFPGGLKVNGLKIVNNNKRIGPSEFWEIETGGMSIRDAIMPMPYSEPSAVLNTLRNEVIQQTQNIQSSAEAQLAQNKGDAPVGTTLALLESSSRIQSSVLATLHLAFSNEFSLTYDLFKEGLDEPYEFSFEGQTYIITKEDFQEDFQIVSVLDPSLTTNTQRILRAEGILRIAQTHPSYHNIREVLYLTYESMGLSVDDISKILISEQEVVPLDPITENMNAMQNKPLKAGLYQDHESHNIVHGYEAEKNPDLAPIILAHMREHDALKYVIDMQTAMGITMPDPELLNNINIQNEIAKKAAEVVEQMKQTELANNPPPPNPNEVMMAEIEAKREAEQLRFKIAEMKTETDAFKSQMNLEIEKIKIESQEKIAEAKNEISLLIAELKAKDVESKVQLTKETVNEG